MAGSGPLQVVGVQPYGAKLPGAQTTTLAKSRQLEILRLVVRKGEDKAPYVAPGELVLHCLEGRVIVTAFGEEHQLRASELIYLPADTSHSLRALDDASLLLIVLRDTGQRGAELARESGPAGKESQLGGDIIGSTGTRG